ncbi:MarR family winged helix-turn-helix transcriptional regulator [Peterkaempfera bronchialis]|uniref:MarR family transcriptional regulator n=1 Tax=Peterkaempfera bronchialis TaxID=2126346 RepID=A0A345SZE1_9ACTN|nr:MarR family transcriptional regulator [Peterkaempfera bronchialis]AXI79096.1 MarR family transcriptional regulator [Peterkaempfera bronchialis]
MRTTPEEALRLENQVCFALHAANRAFGSVYRVLLRDTGLTYPQYLVMLVLWEHGETTVKGLGEALRLDSGTLSPLLKRLEAAGLVERRRSPQDERSVSVNLTPAGAELRHRACEVPLRIAASTGLTLEGMAELRTRLNALTHALDAAVETAAADDAAADEEPGAV